MAGIMEVLQSTKGQGANLSLPDSNPKALEAEEMMRAAPIPGQSLTQSPDMKAPYETPPEITDQQEFLDGLFMGLTDSEALPRVLDTLRSGIPVEDFAEKILKKSMQQGKITTDMMLLNIEPVIYILLSLASYADIDATLYPEENWEDDEESVKTEEMRLMREQVNEPGTFDISQAERPEAVSESLLSRAKEAVGSTGTEGEL